jgi:hypothetical protein
MKEYFLVTEDEKSIEIKAIPAPSYPVPSNYKEAIEKSLGGMSNYDDAVREAAALSIKKGVGVRVIALERKLFVKTNTVQEGLLEEM